MIIQQDRARAISAGLARFGPLRSVTHSAAPDGRRACYGLAARNAIDPGAPNQFERTCELGYRRPQDSSWGAWTETDAGAHRPQPAPLSLPHQRSARNAAIAAVSSGAAKALP